jgi:hypothetical protein
MPGIDAMTRESRVQITIAPQAGINAMRSLS